MLRNPKLHLTDYCSALLIILFMYAGLSKFLDYNTFQQQLGLSPLITKQYTSLVAVFVPFTEILIAIFLLTNKYRKIAFYLSLFILTIFTTYIFMLLDNDFVPCSCGGILGTINWNTHIWFNIFFILVSIIGILKTTDAKK